MDRFPRFHTRYALGDETGSSCGDSTLMTSAPQSAKMTLAEPWVLRNEFLEAEIDPATGCLRTIRDQRTRTNRLGQQLVYYPGSNMQYEDRDQTLLTFDVYKRQD